LPWQVQSFWYTKRTMMKATLVGLCSLLLTSLAHAAVEEKKDYRWEFPVMGITGIAIKGVVATIRIDTDRKESIQIRATRTVRAKDKNSAQLTLKETVPTCLNEAGTLVLEDVVPQHLIAERFVEDAPDVELEIEVHVPAGLRLSSAVEVGTILIAGEAAALTIKSGTGLVRLDNLKVVKGGTVIGMDNGDLELVGSFNDLQATLRVGSIRATLDVATANRVALQTQVGSITTQLKTAPKQSLSASVSVGNVVVRVPGNVKGDASVSTQSGKFRSDFNLSRRPRSVADTGGLLTGTLNKGTGVNIRVTAGVGDAILEKG
jgi:hypothetical protein